MATPLISLVARLGALLIPALVGVGVQALGCSACGALGAVLVPTERAHVLVATSAAVHLT